MYIFYIHSTYVDITLEINRLILPVIILKIVSSMFCLSKLLKAGQACQWPTHVSVRDKTWKETIFKIMAGKINVSISSIVDIYIVYFLIM